MPWIRICTRRRGSSSKLHEGDEGKRWKGFSDRDMTWSDFIVETSQKMKESIAHLVNILYGTNLKGFHCTRKDGSERNE